MSEVKSNTQILHAPASVPVTMTPPTDNSFRAYIKTKYIETLLKDVSIFHNILAAFSTWILLAGFLVLPSTFEILRELPINAVDTAFKKVLSDVQNLPLLGVGFSCCTIGGIGMCFLWWRQRAAYTWLVSKIFVPGLLSGLGGLISTFVSIYTHNKGVYGASSIATVAVTGATIVICGFLAALYSFLLFRLKNEHHKEQNVKGNEAGTESGAEKESS